MRVEDLFARDAIAVAEAEPQGNGVFAVMFVRPGGEHFQRFGYTTSASDVAQIGRAAFRSLMDAARIITRVSHLRWVPFNLGHPAHYGASDSQAAFESFNAVTLSYKTVSDWDETEARAQFIEALDRATILRNLLGDDLYDEYLATEID